MKKISTISILVFMFTIVSTVYAETNVAPTTKSFKVGDVSIVLPPPTNEFVEVGYDNRERMELFVIATNRLISGFMLPNEIQRLTSGQPLSKYAMVQIPRQVENMDCNPLNFEQVTSSIKKDSKNLISSEALKEAEEEVNRRMRSLNAESLKLGAPLQIGTFFDKKDAYCAGMVIPMKQGSRTVNMGGAAVLVRAKKRLLFLYLYAEYKNEETIKWLKDTAESWTDNILKANQ